MKHHPRRSGQDRGQRHRARLEEPGEGRSPRHHGQRAPRARADHQRDVADVVVLLQAPRRGSRDRQALPHDGGHARLARHALARRGARRGQPNQGRRRSRGRSGGEPQGRDRRSGARTRLHCGARGRRLSRDPADEGEEGRRAHLGGVGETSRPTTFAAPSPRSESRLSPVESVDVRTVRRLQHGEAYRHRFGALNRFLDWAVHEDRIAANPCASIGRAYRPAAGGERERTPTLKELALVWTAAETALEPMFRDFVRFAITHAGAPRRDRQSPLGASGPRRPGLASAGQADQEPRRARAAPQSARARDPDPALGRRRAARRWGWCSPRRGRASRSPPSPTCFRALHRATPAVEPWALHDCDGRSRPRSGGSGRTTRRRSTRS